MSVTYTPEQSAAIGARGKTVVSASAGSGKTFVMIEKLVSLILSEADIGDFLAVSVSDKGIVESRACRQFRSNHAGMTREEMEIPWIVVRR